MGRENSHSVQCPYCAHRFDLFGCPLVSHQTEPSKICPNCARCLCDHPAYARTTLLEGCTARIPAPRVSTAVSPLHLTFERRGGRSLATAPHQTSGKQWILVVEDDPDIAQLVCFNLERQGLPATSVADGEHALAVVEKDPPALIILDLMLPGMTGIEVCRRIRSDATTAALPIVMLTARAAEADRMLGLRAGADDYVTKPFSPRDLRRPRARRAAPRRRAGNGARDLNAGWECAPSSRRHRLRRRRRAPERCCCLARVARCGKNTPCGRSRYLRGSGTCYSGVRGGERGETRYAHCGD